MKTKTVKTRPQRPPRHFPDDIDGILHGYGDRARVVQLWRQLDGTHDKWTYLGRLHPSESDVMQVAERFGGGQYRAKILGAWDAELRREEYFEQVSFGIAEQAWPVTAETRGRIRTQHGI